MAALAQVLGGNASEQLVRPPASQAELEAQFSLCERGVELVAAVLHDAQLPARVLADLRPAPAELTIRREVPHPRPSALPLPLCVR